VTEGAGARKERSWRCAEIEGFVERAFSTTDRTGGGKGGGGTSGRRREKDTARTSVTKDIGV